MATRLPASAQARLERFGSTASHTSLLSVPSAVALHSVGLDPLGDVMGCTATQISHQWSGRCGRRIPARYGREPPRIWTGPSPVVLSTNAGPTRVSYVMLLNGAYRTALNRLRAEASALGADGVVDITLTRVVHEQLHEVVAIGTALQARSHRRPKQPFTTDRSGADVAKLMLSGWAPVSLHAVVQLGARHLEYGTTLELRSGLNTEITARSQLVQRTRNGAGALLRSAFAAAGADGGLLSQFTTDEWSARCLQIEGEDEVACTVAIGTSIVRFGSDQQPAPTPLSIMPVNPAGGRP